MYLSIPGAARKWQMAPDELRRKCELHLIPKAVRFGYRWLIPADALRPSAPIDGQTSA